MPLSSPSLSWNEYGLLLAEIVSLKSKDPSTKCGAVILTADHRPLSFGFNGFPRGVRDTQERYDDRPTKYKLVAHAERNALDLCETRPAGATMFVNKPFVCNECAKSIIQNGIKKVIVNKNGVFGSGKGGTWEQELVLTKTMFQEAGVEFIELDIDPVTNKEK